MWGSNDLAGRGQHLLLHQQLWHSAGEGEPDPTEPSWKVNGLSTLPSFLKKYYSTEKLVTLFFIVQGGGAKNDRPNHHLRGSQCRESWKLDPSTEQISMKQTSLLPGDLDRTHPAKEQLSGFRKQNAGGGGTMFFPCHLCPLKPEWQLIKSSLGAHGTQRSREAAASCQSAWPQRGWCTVSGRPSQAADRS